MDARTLHRLLFLFVLAGLGLSVYAAFEVTDPALQHGCTVNGFFSCAAVTASGRTSIGPFPDWAIGVGGFVLLLALDLPLLRYYTPSLLLAVLLVSLAGLGVAAYLAYIEVAIIGAVCPVCLGTYIADAGVLALALALFLLRRERDRAQPAGVDAENSAPSPAA